MRLVPTLIGLLLAAYGWADSGPPTTLLTRVVESELIVLAEVAEVVDVPEQEGDSFDQVTTRLAVQKVLKGLLLDSTVDVHSWHCSGTCSPSPPPYKPGETVLAFLSYRAEGDGYTTYGSPEGAMALAEDQLQLVEARVREMVGICDIESDLQRLSATADWLVRCAVDPLTRLDAMAELVDLFSRHPQDSRWSPQELAGQLTAAHRAMLFAALEGAEEIGFAELRLAPLLGVSYRDELTELLLDRLHTEQSAHSLQQTMYLVADLKEDSLLRQMAGELECTASSWVAPTCHECEELVERFRSWARQEE